eukprot:Plantae.Rhodophyta-Purpureofilum_apyrenoidigerum.ctg25859.p1 GENE.Plantae.Rhodophyta-Purpureofilum_apyrenoidigerum.ctg25859~~Plantae.Rhodophyta-Purpureofilum_apyrenoidigerum.ctg25859.p1  ORF type:complete len:272 (-),score=53.40 Plantae.Rhodophyta-Purpureofilum_apyrenoidigerum.ctg25859:343-1158(-)
MKVDEQHVQFQRLKNLHRIEKEFTEANIVEKRFGRGMQRLLVDWYNQVRMCLGLSTKCVELAINYFSRFLMKTPVARNFVFNIAMICLFLAIKFCETRHVCLQDLYLCTSEECELAEPKLLHRIEVMVLRVLEWKLNAPTVCEFISLYTTFLDVDEETACGLIKCAEMAIIQCWMLNFSPSLIAAALVTIFCDDSKMDAFSRILEEGHIDKDVLEKVVLFVVGHLELSCPSRKRKMNELDSRAERCRKVLCDDAGLLLSSSPCSSQEEDAV